MREDVLTNFNTPDDTTTDVKAPDAPFFSSFNEELFLTLYGAMLIPVELWLWYVKKTERYFADAVYRLLCELSDNQPITALKIVNRSVRNGWKRLYPLNEKMLKKDNHAREWTTYFEGD